VLHVNLRFYYLAYIEDEGEAGSDKHLVFQLSTGGRFEIDLSTSPHDECIIFNAKDYIATMSQTSPQIDSLSAMGRIEDWVAECSGDYLVGSL
jgi:hypothetical protein